MAAKKGNQKATNQTAKAHANKQEQKTKTSSIDVRIDRLINKESTNVKAIASITMDGFAVHGFKIMDSQKGLFIAMPSTSYVDGQGETQYNDIFHPITKESREELLSKMKEAYEQAVEEDQKQDETEEESEGVEEEPPEIGPVM